jgi:hypothetical protein
VYISYNGSVWLKSSPSSSIASHHPTAMMFDTLARRTVFSKLDNESINLVIAYHGGTMFGIPTAYLTPRTIAIMRRYRDLWTHFSYRIDRGGTVTFAIKFPFDTLQQKCATLSLFRKQEVVVSQKNSRTHEYRPNEYRRHETFVGGLRSTGENIKVYLKCDIGQWHRVADLKELVFEFPA